ncbi:TetR/AcrR family transcriptional regulator [Peribacillus sp. SCS-155]|uniref:TetR/AcrR family transcriptional regulator n=1 Tax=Peribacillus sedimenti TaxID=3115297 RepID=UPI003905BE4F
MNDRKQHVIKMAHQLFVEKGFHATSIQDILEYSGISKGTFYNYFSSKNELLMALFKMIYKKLEQDRNELLIGQDPADIEILIKQISLQFETNRANQLISLFEEAIFSNDEELKEFMKRGQLLSINWLYQRFLDIFGHEKKPYLLDSAITLMGILKYNVKYNVLANGQSVNIQQVVRYCVGRIVKMVDEVADAGDQLLSPELIERWLEEHTHTDQALQQKLFRTVMNLKEELHNTSQEQKYLELLEFIQHELTHSKAPRKFLIESTLSALHASDILRDKTELKKLEQMVEAFFSQLEKTAEPVV